MTECVPIVNFIWTTPSTALFNMCFINNIILNIFKYFNMNRLYFTQNRYMKPDIIVLNVDEITIEEQT